MAHATPLHRHWRSALLTLTLVLALGAAPAAGADTTLATTARSSQLSAGFGVVLYSAWDESIQRYRLMQVKDEATSAVPVAPNREPFQADVGPTKSGHAYYVYVRCDTAPGGCDLFTYNPTIGVELQSKASDPKHSEGNPTYWRGRLAFTREYGSPGKPRQIVYQRPTGNTSRSVRLPGLPEKRCDQGQCIDPQANFLGMELYGEQLGQIDIGRKIKVYPEPGGKPLVADDEYTDVRLVNVRTNRSRQLISSGRGEGGQRFTGIAFDAGKLYAAFACLGDPGGCTRIRAGIYRFRYATGEFALSPVAPTLNALAVDDGSTYELRDGGDSLACDANDLAAPDAPRCSLIRREPAPGYEAIEAP